MSAKYPLPYLPPEREKPVTHPEPPPGLYAAPSFKFRHEVREPLENGEVSYHRAFSERNKSGAGPHRGLRARRLARWGW